MTGQNVEFHKGLAFKVQDQLKFTASEIHKNTIITKAESKTMETLCSHPLPVNLIPWGRISTVCLLQ